MKDFHYLAVIIIVNIFSIETYMENITYNYHIINKDFTKITLRRVMNSEIKKKNNKLNKFVIHIIVLKSTRNSVINQINIF